MNRISKLESIACGAPMEKIIERPIVKHPAFSSQMVVLLIEESRVLVVFLKFNQREMILPGEHATPLIIRFASQPRNALLIVKLAIHWHANEERLGAYFCQRTQ